MVGINRVLPGLERDLESTLCQKAAVASSVPISPITSKCTLLHELALVQKLQGNASPPLYAHIPVYQLPASSSNHSQLKHDWVRWLSISHGCRRRGVKPSDERSHREYRDVERRKYALDSVPAQRSVQGESDS